jgi:hypothetical protein
LGLIEKPVDVFPFSIARPTHTSECQYSVVLQESKIIW